MKVNLNERKTVMIKEYNTPKKWMRINDKAAANK